MLYKKTLVSFNLFDPLKKNIIPKASMLPPVVFTFRNIG